MSKIIAQSPFYFG